VFQVQKNDVAMQEDIMPLQKNVSRELIVNIFPIDLYAVYDLVLFEDCLVGFWAT
jgi:hypothetical protein